HVAALVNCEATHVTFTSGATEANATVLNGALVARTLVCATEHLSVLENLDSKDATMIPVDRDGLIDLEFLAQELKKDGQALVSVMWVNNETGVIQPVDKIATLCAEHGALFHCDAVQAAGRLPIDLTKT